MFDQGYFDLKRLYHINEIEAYFVIRQRGNLQYEVINEGDTMHNAGGVLSDQVIRLTNYLTKQKYPAVLRRVTYYAADKNKTYCKVLAVLPTMKLRKQPSRSIMSSTPSANRWRRKQLMLMT